jgi:hypothetical protein
MSRRHVSSKTIGNAAPENMHAEFSLTALAYRQRRALNIFGVAAMSGHCQRRP